MMAGKFLFKKFSEIDLSDPFFDSLKEDYPPSGHSTDFETWFNKKSAAASTVLVFYDDDGLGAFVYLKDENEVIELVSGNLPAIPRVKIGTLRLAERYRGQRLGEGAIGLALWKWQQTKTEEIYVTVFEKHDALIRLFERFGFLLAGQNLDGERVYIKSRNNVDYSEAYKSFPFVNPAFTKAGYLIVNDVYHDTLFPYSELSRTLQESVGLAVANGLCKIYVGAQYSRPHYQACEPILIYRRHTQQDGQKPRYKSCVTSYCIVNDVITVKTNNRCHISFEELKARIGNKSVFDEHEMKTKYDNDKNLVVIEMLYYGYFGEGNNVNMDWLDRNGYWAKTNEYPANVQLSPAQFKAILREGNIDVPNVIIN
jgi:RimJ/RimL family protein N-acetyltransferase